MNYFYDFFCLYLTGCVCAGIDDLSYESVFKPVIEKVMDIYRPTAIVLQCGADSLTGDRLGNFNLTLRGHAACVQYVKSFNVPTLVLGGGGYTVRNVARCWAYETSVLLNQPVENQIPYNDFFEYYAPDFLLHLTPSSAENLNKPDILQNIVSRVLQNLKNIQGAPSVQMQPIPPDFILADTVKASDMEDAEPDKRLTVSYSSDGAARPDHPLEFYDSEKDRDRGDDFPISSESAAGITEMDGVDD